MSFRLFKRLEYDLHQIAMSYYSTFRQFVMKLEKTSEQKPLPHQEYVAQYVKAYYIPESDLENWVKYHTVSLYQK